MADDKNKKEYTAQDVIGILQDLMNKVSSGDLSGTVLGTPMDAAQYDAVSANSHAMVQAYLGRYSSQMLLRHRLTRTGATAAAFGLGAGGAAAIDALSRVSPELGNNLIGLPGLDQAREIALRGANGLAAATGRPLGGVTNPHQMASNVQWAATQGAMALNNAFNKDGSINARFTHGLSLPQAAVLNNAILSDSSHYEEWGNKELDRTRKWMSEHKDATERQRLDAGILTENQIGAFKNGTGLTGAAVKSFNDHIKDFQEEMNGFVASVSKITGSFDTAIDFIQDLTNGKAFSAGADAKDAREKAARMAANLRVMAADAEMDPKQLYGMMNDPYRGIGVLYDAARGTDPAARYVGDRSTTANIAALSAGAMAQWAKTHPGASSADQERARASIEQRAQNFAKGNADEHNVLLAEMVRRGDLSAEEAKKLAASGNQKKVYQTLKDYWGNDVDSLLKNRVQLERLSKKNSPMVNELNTLSFNEGFTNEDVYKNQQNAMRDGKMALSSRLGAVLGKNVTVDVDRLHKEALLDEDVLRAAGLDDEKIETIRKKGRKWNASEIHRHLVSKMGADELALNRETSKALGDRLDAKYGDNEKAKKAIAQFREDLAETMPELTEDDIRKHVAVGKSVAVTDRLGKTRNAYMGAMRRGDQDKMFEALTRMGEELRSSVSGEGDTFNKDAGFTGFMLEEILRSQTSDTNKADTLRDIGTAVFKEADRSGLSYGQAMDLVKKNLMADKNGKGMSFDALTDPRKREEMLRRYTLKQAAYALGHRVVESADLSKEDAELVETRFLSKGVSDGDIKRYASEEGAKNLKGAELDNYIARRIAVETLTKDSEINEVLKKANMSTDAIRNIGNTEEAMRIVNAKFLGGYDNVKADVGELKKDVDTSSVSKDELDRLALRKASGNVDNIAFSSQLSMVSSDALDSAVKELAADRMDTVYALDAEQASGVNRPLGKIEGIDREILKSRLGIDRKKDAVKGMLEGPNSLEAQQQPDGLNKKAIARRFQEFLSEHEGLSDSELLSAFADDKDMGRIKGAYAALRDAREVGEGGKKGAKMSTRGMLEAYIHAANADSGNVDADVENGLMASAIRHKDPAASGVNDEAVTLLRLIEQKLETISGNQDVQKHM